MERRHNPTQGNLYEQIPLWPSKEMPHLYRLCLIDDHIKRSGGLFKRFRFSSYGAPPGTTRAVLANPERFWRRIEKNGTVFYEPLNELKKIHDRFRIYFSRRVDLAGPATAYWVGSSIVKNGKIHSHNRSSLSLDMKNAFESIKTKHLYRYLCRSETLLASKCPSVLESQTLELRRDEAWVLSRLLTYRGRLRKGSPSSPLIFNMLCGQLDKAIAQVISTFRGMAYTRYGDDLGFSSPEEVFPAKAEEAIREVLSAQCIALNERKTKHCSGGILEFPGVVIIGGRVRPRGGYIATIVKRYSEMSTDERGGHRGFLYQFGRRVPKVLKRFLAVP